ncbi:SulP family inorganic anion transporter [Egibacter rhizosphaerae]|uniref:SulP family inorganic anion transporter n=1 Tax=Egibacter rhizosphaerae TaxID=1670831 RepID=A0A411YFA7_9ACTN|nr:SulP family inorganic anion transporter [Egibacter rhizosphaerae]
MPVGSSRPWAAPTSPRGSSARCRSPGGFSRSAVNHEAGARTPAASLVTAALIVVVATVATPLLEPLPRAVLGGVIVVAVLRLVDLPEIVRLWREHRAEGTVAGVTFVATLTVGVEPGLGVGVVAGLLAAAWRRRESAHDARTDSGHEHRPPTSSSAPGARLLRVGSSHYGRRASVSGVAEIVAGLASDGNRSVVPARPGPPALARPG